MKGARKLAEQFVSFHFYNVIDSWKQTRLNSVGVNGEMQARSWFKNEPKFKIRIHHHVKLPIQFKLCDSFLSSKVDESHKRDWEAKEWERNTKRNERREKIDWAVSSLLSLFGFHWLLGQAMANRIYEGKLIQEWNEIQILFHFPSKFSKDRNRSGRFFLRRMETMKNGSMGESEKNETKFRTWFICQLKLPKQSYAILPGFEDKEWTLIQDQFGSRSKLHVPVDHRTKEWIGIQNTIRFPIKMSKHFCCLSPFISLLILLSFQH